jgi:hypothetical protein
MSLLSRSGVWMALACALTLTACEKLELDERAIRFNGALADAENRQVLLNAVRASKRYPLFFTSISKISSSGMADGSTLGFSIPFGPRAGLFSRTFTPSLRLSEGMNVDTAPLNTQEFYQGIMKPLTFRDMDYYLLYDWDPELIYYAMIRKVVLTRGQTESIRASANASKKCTAKDGRKDGSFNSTLSCFGDQIPNRDILNSPNPIFKTLIDDLGKLDAIRIADDEVEFINSPTDVTDFIRFQLLVAQLRALDMKIVKFERSDDETSQSENERRKSDADAAKSDGEKKRSDGVGAKSDTGKSSSNDVHLTVSVAKDEKPKDNKIYAFELNRPMKGQGCTTSGVKPRKTLFPAMAAKAQKKSGQSAAITTEGDADLKTEQGIVINTEQDVVLKNSIGEKNLENYVICYSAETPALVLRSVEGLVFYMGSLVTAETYDNRQNDPREYLPYLPSVNVERVEKGAPTSKSAPLFLACQSGSPANQDGCKQNHIVEVNIDGDEFYVPAPNGGAQTMHFLSLTQQLLNTYRKASELPSTPTARLIGGQQ